jgi:DNA (cytosine-5)-methyltransferase 1
MMSRSRKTTASRNRRSARKQPGAILDLFAGAGGWEVALAMLGLQALGIETDPHACATAQTAGFERLQADVAKLDPLQFAPVWGRVGSPPCQAYSSAGKGLGRKDKPLVIACAHELAAGNDSRRAWQEGCRDPRSLLTVEPLRYIVALRPRWVALEQVPAVLELWTLFAGLLAQHGYQTVAGVLSAERYGVPQTRKRAFLIASLDGPVSLPAPTHRSYNPRRSEIPEDELALEPWVSMAEALGWAPCEGVGFPRRTDTPSNRPSKTDTGTHRARDRRPASRPALTLTAKTRSWTRKPCVQIRRGGKRIDEGFDPTSSPAQAVTTRVNRWQAQGVDPDDVARERACGGEDWPARRPAMTLVTTRRSRDGVLVGRQLPPGQGRERGGWAWRNGNQPNSAIRASAEPAPTVHFGHRSNRVEWIADHEQASGEDRGPGWAGERPATTVACDRRVHPPGHKQNASDPPGRYQQRRGANAVRVTVSQAAVLQGFPADYPWQGARTRQFEQVGNAVPPPLARHVLEAATRHVVSDRGRALRSARRVTVPSQRPQRKPQRQTVKTCRRRVARGSS